VQARLVARPATAQRLCASDPCPAGPGMGLAVGSRAHLQAAATAKRSWYRNALMRGFHLLVVLVAGSAVKDTQCGFKARRPPTPGLAAVARLRRRKSLGL